MERSEPALVPEWLRCTGNVAGGSPSSHHFASSSLHSDVSSHPTWNRCSTSNSDKDSQRPAFLERNHTSIRRSSGSNGSAKHPYSNFNRSHRDRNREKDKDRYITGDLLDRDSSDPLENILTRSVESSLRRSQSLVSRRTGEVLPHRTEDSRNCANNHQYSTTGILLGGGNLSSIQKATFDKDFPSLGNEDKQGGSVIGRVPSPVLSTAVQSLPMFNSGLLGGEKWTSALAEVPSVVGSITIGSSSAQQSAVATPSSGASSAMAGLNMAEALSQAPPHARAIPQVPDKTQRLEELAIKQSRQLIPMTPTLPKALVSSSSEKSKQPKAVVRVSEVTVATRNLQQQQQQPHYSSQVSNQSRGGQVRSDASNASHAGKFLVLKAARENGANSTAKDASSLTSNVNANGKVASSLLPLSALTPTALTSPSNPKAFTLEKKAAALTLNPRPAAEKKSSQVQSRSDFFNLMRKKTLINTYSAVPDSSSTVSSPCADKSDENMKESERAVVSPCSAENGRQMISNGGSHGAYDEAQSFARAGDRNMSLNGAVYPDEEEAAFLRSLGWEENGEDVEITDEEIIAFYKEYQKFMPSFKVWRGIQTKCSVLSEFHYSNSVAASSDSGSAGSESEA